MLRPFSLRTARALAFLVDELFVLGCAAQIAFVALYLEDFVPEFRDPESAAMLREQLPSFVLPVLAIAAWAFLTGPRLGAPSLGYLLVGVDRPEDARPRASPRLLRIGIPTSVGAFLIVATATFDGSDGSILRFGYVALAAKLGLGVVVATIVIDALIVLLRPGAPTIGQRLAGVDPALEATSGLARALRLTSQLVWVELGFRLVGYVELAIDPEGGLRGGSTIASALVSATVPAVAVVLARVLTSTDERAGRSTFGPLAAFFAVGIPGVSFVVLRRWAARLAEDLELDAPRATGLRALVDAATLLRALRAGLTLVFSLALFHVPLPVDPVSILPASWVGYLSVVETAATALLLHRLAELPLDVGPQPADPSIAETFA